MQIAKLERAKGIEPSSSAWEADALPLCYARLMAGILAGFSDKSSLKSGIVFTVPSFMLSFAMFCRKGSRRRCASSLSVALSDCATGPAARVKIPWNMLRQQTDIGKSYRSFPISESCARW